MAAVIDLSDLSETSSSNLESSSLESSPDVDNKQAIVMPQAEGDEQGEFWSALGPEWSRAKVQYTADTADKVHFRRLLGTPAQRSTEFAEEFLEAGHSTQLNKKHFYAVLIYTRGTRVNKVPCHRCKTPGMKVFPQCITLIGMAQNACAADLWAGTQQDCDHHNDNVNALASAAQSDENIATPSPKRLQHRVAGKFAPVNQQPQNTRPETSPASLPPKSTARALTRAAQRKSIAPLSRTTRASTVAMSITDDEDEDETTVKLRHLQPKRLASIANAKSVPSAPKVVMNLAKGTKSTTIKTKFPVAATSASATTNSSANSTINGTNVSTAKKRRYNEVATEDTDDVHPATLRPRLDAPVKDTLDYLSGDFDYAAAELALEITPDMIAEAKRYSRIMVGKYLLCRFTVEMNVMWAIRVAAARWAQGY